MDIKKITAISDIAIKWCILAVLFAAPFSKSIAEIGMVVSIVLWALNKIITRDFRINGAGLGVALFIFVITMIPSFLNSHYMAVSVKALFSKVLKYVVFYLVIVDSVNTKEKLKDLFVIGLLSAAVIMIDGFVQHFYAGTDGLHNYPSFKARLWDGEYMGYFRGFPTASFPFPNDFASWILLIIFPLICASLFSLKKNIVRIYTGIVSAGLFYMLFLTKTRAAWLGFAASLVFIAVAKKKYWLILLLILILAVPFIFKMEMAGYIFGSASVSDRMDMWSVGWKIFSDHPGIGNGINTFFKLFMENRTDMWRGQKGSYAHNCYLQMAADVGVLGLVGFLGFMGAYFLSVIKNMRHIKDSLQANVLLGIALGVFAFLFLAFFDTNLYSLNLVTLFWCAIGVSQAIILVSKQAD